MKQTAVEWLYKNLLENPISNQDVEYNEAVFHNAKEMEKQQIINTWYDCKLSIIDKNPTDAEQYYKETFNK